MLKPSNAMLKANVNELNEFFISTAKRVTNKTQKKNYINDLNINT